MPIARRQRKLYRANYERYVAEAKLKNIQRAAEKLLAQRQAAEELASKKPPASVAADAQESAQEEVEKTA